MYTFNYETRDAYTTQTDLEQHECGEWTGESHTLVDGGWEGHSFMLDHSIRDLLGTLWESAAEGYHVSITKPY